MAGYELKMPKLGESVTEGTIGKWLKQPGEKVNKYDLLVEVQTDKVNTEIPSPVAGTLKEVKVEEGQTVPIGTLLAVFDTADSEPAAQPSTAEAAAPAAPDAGTPPGGTAETRAATGTAAPQRPSAPSAPRAGAPSRPPLSPPPGAPEAAPASPSEADRPDLSDVRATPAVRRLAAEHDIDISQIEGTGLGGRVSRKDVEEFIAGQAAKAGPVVSEQPQAAQQRPSTIAPRPSGPPPLVGDTPVPLTQMRRAIANNMAQAWTAPHAHAVMEVDMTNVMKYREMVRGEFQDREGFDLSPAAFIVKAAVEALRQVPLANASWTDDGIVIHHAINVGYAVALGDEGLVVPVIREADSRSIAGLMRAIRDIVDRAKGKKLTFDDFTGGTFTVNNTGPLGTIVSSPIVPPGQAAIVSSETIRKRLVVTDEETIAIRSMMNLVIGFDHRVIDGATAARLLGTMRDWLQRVNESVPVY
jgi:2-oxoisovalerate dehydrogenase E2 component (dihydrolipoyl transacylase)